MARYRDPFEFGRIEQEQSPTIYVPDRALQWLTSQSHRFEGPRGSGKSSLLSAFRWELSWGKPPLMNIHCSTKVRSTLYENPAHLGVYYRFEEMDVPYWDQWADRVGESYAAKYFGTYCEYTFVFELLDALHCTRINTGRLFTRRSSEITLVESLLRRLFPKAADRPHLIEKSFSALRDVILDLQLGLRDLVFREREREEVTASYPVLGPGDIVRTFSETFVQVYPEQDDWIVIVLLDDCNLLSEWQAMVLNTAIAKAGNPLSYKLSCVSNLYPTTRTLHPARSIVEHDLPVVRLLSDSFYHGKQVGRDKSYLTIANQVCKIRIEKYYGQDAAESFDLAQVLGPFELESALLERLGDSEKYEDVQAFLDRAKTRGKTARITATWLSDNMIRPEPEDTSSDPAARKRAARRLASKYFKKWNHAAAVALMREYRLVFPYWGVPVILSLGTGSIREILRIMSGMWQAARMPVDRFVGQSPLAHKTQQKGVTSAAKKFLKSLDIRPLSEDGPSLQEICLRLGGLLKYCQSPKYMRTTPETAAIRTHAADLDEELDGIVCEGLTAGAILKKQEEDSEMVEIALHPIMAPYFCLSYRNPFYYAEPITKELLRGLLTGTRTAWTHARREILVRRLHRQKSDKSSGPVGSPGAGRPNNKQGTLFG